VVGPGLKLLEKCGIDDCKAKADAPFFTHPDDPGLGAKNAFGIRQREAHIEKAGEAHRFSQSVQPHAAGAQVRALDAHFVPLLVFQCNGKLNAGAEEFLLIEADEPQRVHAVPGGDVDVVLLEFAAESATGNAQLVRGVAAVAATPLQSADDHLLFHAVEVADRHGRSLAKRGGDVVGALNQIRQKRGTPKLLFCDNGSEFTSQRMDLWAYHNQVQIDFSRPGKPTGNAYVESFNGTLRAECLDVHWFATLTEAKQVIEDRRREYNESRPHRSLGERTPSEFACQIALNGDLPSSQAAENSA